MLYLEAPSEIEPPKRYRNDYGQLLEHAPYSQRDLHAPDEVAAARRGGRLRRSTSARRDRITAYHYRHHPFDVVGWDGYLWPFRFNIGDFQPITGRVHQPPPVHQTFQARNFVVCSFVPRKFDYHPLAIPAPYNHSNINSDEVIYYVAGNFMSRRGVEIASFTLHPAGIPHGPHPGTVEASIGKEATEELAVMVDTFHPLKITKAAMDLDDDRYPYRWLPSADHARKPPSSQSEARRRSRTDRATIGSRTRRSVRQDERLEDEVDEDRVAGDHPGAARVRKHHFGDGSTFTHDGDPPRFAEDDRRDPSSTSPSQASSNAARFFSACSVIHVSQLSRLAAHRRPCPGSHSERRVGRRTEELVETGLVVETTAPGSQLLGRGSVRAAGRLIVRRTDVRPLPANRA